MKVKYYKMSCEIWWDNNSPYTAITKWTNLTEKEVEYTAREWVYQTTSFWFWVKEITREEYRKLFKKEWIDEI